MRHTRLFVAAPLAAGRVTALPEAAARHALRVVRLVSGDRIVAFNGDGHEYPAHLIAEDARHARIRVESVQSPERESPLRITLVQALARGEKMDWIVQKATELGAAAIVPVTTERSEVRLDAGRAAKRLAHWQAIARAACEQCGRNVVPEIAPPDRLDVQLASAPCAPSSIRWMLHPGESMRMRDLAAPPVAVTLAVGPEGGFGAHDLAVLRGAGYVTLGIGPRILRTETAGIAVVAGLQALYGDG